MMASDILCIVCVVLCAVRPLHSYSISGTIEAEIGEVHDVNVSNYVNGEHWGIIQTLTLDRLEGAETLPTLTIANFYSIDTLNLSNIALEHVPVFVNTAISLIFITGNKIKRVPSYAFTGPDPRVLDLSNNEIQSMAEKSVHMFAEEVYLECNKIRRFTQSWFSYPLFINILHLGGNRIEYIEDRAFNNMPRLNRLHLNNNHITSIGSDAFNSAIMSLYLQFNGISRLTADMFVHQDVRMYTLSIHHNQLNYLPEELLQKLKPRFITFFGNPWQCQCLLNIERWVYKLNLTGRIKRSRRSEPVCAVPLTFPNLCTPAVDNELQEWYARGLSPVQGCWATPCIPCQEGEDRYEF